jgi:orotidine-5'-phosphate decarboxylase
VKTHRPKTDLIVALDYPRADYAIDMVERLSGLPLIYKVGLELFLAGGHDLVRDLVHKKERVFLDLKFHDIPNTVARAARQAALLQVEMFTLHLSGGSQMVRAVANEMAEIGELKPKILGVTILTSFDDVGWAEVSKSLSGHASTVSDSVEGLSSHAVAWGVDGMVCSAFELSLLRETHPDLYIVVPGIRPIGTSRDDQARVMTPSQARAAGASAVVVGRPITQAPNPREVVEDMLKYLSEPSISS